MESCGKCNGATHFGQMEQAKGQKCVGITWERSAKLAKMQAGIMPYHGQWIEGRDGHFANAIAERLLLAETGSTSTNGLKGRPATNVRQVHN
jgi:hypothetical protein